MRTLRLFMTMSCDGYFAGPDGELDWIAAAPDPEMTSDVVGMIESSDTAFMGYPVAMGMIPYWHQAAVNPAASDAERALGQAISKVHSLVLSSTPVETTLDNADILVVRDDDELRAAVLDVKKQPGRDIGVPGGVRTARTFARLGLIDEYVLMVHPVALGDGQRIFTQRTDLTLDGVKPYSSGVTRLTYRSAWKNA